MDHKTLKERLFALYDGELEAAEREKMRSHLDGCLECRELYERWTKTAKVFFKAPKSGTSEFFVQRVMDRIHTLEAPKHRAPGWNVSLQWLVPAVGGLALLFLAVVLPAPQTVSIDAMLFQEASGRPLLAFSDDALSTDETLQFVMEGQR